MFNFSTAKVRCSSIYQVMGAVNGKTNLQKWEEMCEELARQQLKKEKMKKKDGPGYAKTLDTIERLENCLKVFDKFKKDEPALSDGCKNYLTMLYGMEKYGKWSPSKEVGNKYTTKGKEAEADGIQLSSLLDGELYYKNELMIENDWLKGTPDIIVGNDPYDAEKIIDIKCPWDCETFFSNLGRDEVPNQYYWQVQGYMAISNAPVAEVHFCLVNLPEWMLNRQRELLLSNMGVVTELDPKYIEVEKELVKNLTFDDIPDQERRIKFTVERNEEDIQKIYRQVERCRPFLEEIQKRHLLGVNSVILEEISKSEAEV